MEALQRALHLRNVDEEDDGVGGGDGTYMQKAGDCGDISPQFFWIFRKILGWEREINTAPKPSPEVAPSKMEVAPF